MRVEGLWTVEMRERVINQCDRICNVFSTLIHNKTDDSAYQC